MDRCGIERKGIRGSVPDSGVDVAKVTAEKSYKKAAIHGRVLGSNGCDFRRFVSNSIFQGVRRICKGGVNHESRTVGVIAGKTSDEDSQVSCAASSRRDAAKDEARGYPNLFRFYKRALQSSREGAGTESRQGRFPTKT